MHNTKSKPSDYEQPVVTVQSVTMEEGFATSPRSSVENWEEEETYSLYF